jgi:hypothetical protein
MQTRLFHLPGRASLGRLRRSALAAMVAAALYVPLAASTQPSVPAPAPVALPPISAGTLDAAYAANRANMATAARMATAAGDLRRGRVLTALAAPGRHFLTFDGRGAGRATEVLGDLAGADRIAVLVPGSDTTLDTFDGPFFRPGGAARALYAQIHQEDPAAKVAVVAWLGYTTPKTISTTVMTTGRANVGARALRRFVDTLRQVNGRAPVSLLCHSYGSVVCGRAAAGLTVADIALFGSPGVGARSVAALGTPAQVWAGRGTDDWIAGVPHVSISVFGTTIGFGTDPVSARFGARVFAAGAGGHSDYFDPSSAPLLNLARIVLGDDQDVTRA